MGILREATDWLASRGIEWWAAGFPEEGIRHSVDRGDIYLAYLGDEPVGTVTVDFWPDPEFWGDPPPDAGYAHRLAVRRSASGRGLGALLLDWAGHVVASAARPWLRLDANKDNRRLCQYYKDLGFRHVRDVDLPHRRSGALFERSAKPLSHQSQMDALMSPDQPHPPEMRTILLRQTFLPLAIKHTQTSLDTARALLDAGFPSPAFVWAVRSAEIFFREALLFPFVYQDTGDIRRSFAEVRDFLQGGKWNRAIRRVRDAYGLKGLQHEALIDDGEDAWVHWGKAAVGPRGDIVHGRTEADANSAKRAIQFVDRMREWFTIRIATAKEGPFANLLFDVIAQAQAVYERERQAPGIDE